MLGFGIIGCGMISRFHAKAIGDVRGAKLVACFDQLPAAADKLAAETGCKAYHALDDMLADPRVQVVTIGTPSGAHAEPAVAAARAGKHVIVEKPLEITLRRCDAIIAACQQGGRRRFPRFSPRGSTTAAPGIETGGRCRAVRPPDPRRRLREVVSQPGLLRQRRVARHLGPRRRRGLDEPGHPQRRSAPLADGPGGRGPREDGLAWPTSGSRSRTLPWPRSSSPTERWG